MVLLHQRQWHYRSSFINPRGNEDFPSIFLLTGYSRSAQLGSWKLRGKREGKKNVVAYHCYCLKEPNVPSQLPQVTIFNSLSSVGYCKAISPNA